MEDLHNSANQFFPNNQCMMLQNHALEKDLLQVQDRPTKRSLQSFQIQSWNKNLKNYIVVKFWSSINTLFAII